MDNHTPTAQRDSHRNHTFEVEAHGVAFRITWTVRGECGELSGELAAQGFGPKPWRHAIPLWVADEYGLDDLAAGVAALEFELAGRKGGEGKKPVTQHNNSTTRQLRVMTP
jgi:hypothetical protein